MMDYRGDPFFLDDDQIAWVEKTKSKMSLQWKAAQLFFPIGFDDPGIPLLVKELQPAGLMFRLSPMETVAEIPQQWQEASEILQEP